MAYRRSYLFELTGRFLLGAMELLSILFLFERVDTIGGWTRWEVIYLHGIATVSLGLAEILTSGLDEMGDLVRTGAVDGLLVRPMSPLLQLLGREVRIFHAGRVLRGLFALGLAGSQLTVTGWDALAMVTLSVVSCTVIYAGLFIASAAACFWTVQSLEVFNAFTYGGVEMTQYPISVYPGWLRNLFLYFVPLGFGCYVPAARLLGKDNGLGIPDAFSFAAPLVAAVFFFFCLRFWNLGMNRYQSTGS